LATREVVLLPGLWMPGVAMSLLARRLRRAGFSPRIFSYHGRDPVEANVERLRRFCAGRPHLVGHSLGGIVILETLLRYRELEAASVVLIGSPVRGCHAGRRLACAGVGRWMMGACSNLWMERNASWTRAEPLGVIAGTRPLGLGWIVGGLPEPNDGVVCVSETMLQGMTDQALVPLGHSGLIVSNRVAQSVGFFLKEGRFN
jgi:pimeloyl-ACP methyl ester carboxylesterase